MKNFIQRISILFVLLTSFFSLSAQAEIASGTDWLTYGLIAIIAIIVLFFVVQVGDSFLSLEAKRIGVDQEENNISVFPKWNDIFSPKLPDYLDGEKVIRLKKGHDILLEGKAAGTPSSTRVKSFAVQPKNFVGMSPIPKVSVEVGQKVLAGEELFFDKKNPEIKYVAPVSGEIEIGE
ncbi:MAG: NADH:ubiquinone reductase (Na(+)-transporting) subunit A, partial [Bacteroidota bacterium]